MAWAWHFLAAADAIPRRAPLAWLLPELEEIAMTLREGFHITKDGWILVFMALTLIVSAAGIGTQIWAYYAPISKESFLEYKEGVKNSVALLDARLNRMESKLDALSDYIRGTTAPHGRS